MPTPADVITISDTFDSGNGRRKKTGQRQASGRNAVEIEIRDDVFTEFENKYLLDSNL